MKRTDLPLADNATFRVPVDLIVIPKGRVRSLKPAQARAIGEAMLADRQYDPITIVQLPGKSHFELVDGLHRLVGARAVGMADIEARFAPDSSKFARIKQEILSGWARAGEDVFDRAAGIKIIADLAREAAGLPATGRLKPGPKTDEVVGAISTILRWDIEVGEALGLNGKTVRNYKDIAERIPDEFKLRLRKIGHADEIVPILSLMRLEPAAMAAAVALLEAQTAATIADAISIVEGKPKPDAQTKRFGVVTSSLERMESLERRGVLAHLFEKYRGEFEALLLSMNDRDGASK